MKLADLSPTFSYDTEHIINFSTRFAAKRGNIQYRGLGCFALKCIHPELTCSNCVCSFSSLSPIR